MGQKSSGMQMWGNVGWWIVTVFSVPFGLYTLPFIYGKFEIYKNIVLYAGLENRRHLAGLHILHNLRAWQFHAAAALLFVAIGPFQFNASFRNKYPVLHSRLGYIFAVCTIITAVTGGTTMAKATELGPVAAAISPIMSIWTLIALSISINAARNKNYQSHRRWIMRSAAVGYSVMYTRFPFPLLLMAAFNVPQEHAPVSISLTGQSRIERGAEVCNTALQQRRSGLILAEGFSAIPRRRIVVQFSGHPPRYHPDTMVMLYRDTMVMLHRDTMVMSPETAQISGLTRRRVIEKLR